MCHKVDEKKCFPYSNCTMLILQLAITISDNDTKERSTLRPRFTSLPIFVFFSIKINNLFTPMVSPQANHSAHNENYDFLHVKQQHNEQFYDINGTGPLKKFNANCFSFITTRELHNNVFWHFFLFLFAEPRFKRFRHIWKRSKKSQTPQQIRKVREHSLHLIMWSPSRVHFALAALREMADG